MNGKLVAGLSALGLLGGGALMLAFVLACAGMYAANDADTARKNVGELNTGWTKWINDRTGASQMAEHQIREKETEGVRLVSIGSLSGFWDSEL